MNHPTSAQIIKYCGLFLFLLIFLSVDLAFTFAVSLYLALNSKNYSKLLVISLVLFTADILLNRFDISIRLITDMMLDSYILLLTSLFIYSKSQPRIIEYFQKLSISSRKVFSLNTLFMIGISSIFSILLAPIIGIPFAVISGYISFSYLSKHFEGRYAYIAGLFFLFFSPFFIILKKDSISENFAIISFYFLIIGTFQEIIRLIQVRKGELTKTLIFNLPKVDFSAKILHFFHSVRLPQKSSPAVFQSKEETIDNKVNRIALNKSQPNMKIIIIAGISGLLGFAVTFFALMILL